MNNKAVLSLAVIVFAVASVCAACAISTANGILSQDDDQVRNEDVPVDSWEALQAAITEYQQGQVLVLSGDLTSNNNSTIKVEGKAVTIDLNGHVLNRNLNTKTDYSIDGSVITVANEGSLVLKDSKGTGAVTGGWQATDGGGISIASGCTCVLDGVTIKGNLQERYGGGIYAEGCLTMTDVTIKDNIAKGRGGAVYVQNACYDLYAGGRICATDNEASFGNCIYMVTGTFIKFSEALDNGSRLRVMTETDPYVFTLGFSDANPGHQPEDFFISDYGYAVEGYGTEAVLVDSDGWEIEDGMFIDWRDRINPDYYSLTGANWMSGISGERYITEINMMETHNACTCDVSIYGTESTTSTRPEFYETQKLYARGLMEAGVRCFDIRLMNWYYDDNKDHFDDGHTLWIGHGKGSYHMALDERGNKISFDTLLNWVMEFLIENPSETMTLDLQPEVKKDDEEREYMLILERTMEYLERYDAYINPSTGEKFLYSEDGAYGEKFTYIPKLKDCRGKIIITCSSENAETIGGMVYEDILIDKVYSVRDGQSVGVEKRIENIMEVYNAHCHEAIPTDATSHLDFLNMISINCTDRSIGVPMAVEALMFDRIFSTMHLLEDRGTYYGFWRGDAITEWEANYIWRTNYSDSLQYCTVTVKSGIEGIPDQTFILLKGTPITIPGCIYPVTPEESFGGWMSGESIYVKGDSFTVSADVTFTAKWTQVPTVVPVTQGGEEPAAEGSGDVPETVPEDIVTEEVPVDSWSALKAAIKAATAGQVLVLTQDLECSDDMTIKVEDRTVTIDLNGHKLDRHQRSYAYDGSVITLTNRSILTLIDSKGTGAVTGGWQATDGGGIQISAGSTCIIQGVRICGNMQDRNGGGIYAEGCLTMTDVTIEDNIAKGKGGAVCIQNACYDFKVSGRICATDNEGSFGNGIYMMPGTFIAFLGPLDDRSLIRVMTEIEPYMFTHGFPDANPGHQTEDFFITDYGYAFEERNGDAVLVKGGGWQYKEGQFLDWRDSMNPDYYSLTGANWMSGISGERRLNEINTPETHNACTCDVSPYGATVKYGPEYYETQKRFARGLLEAGVRGLDIRLINWYYGDEKEHYDDGRTLWIGHGKDYDSYHMALDERGSMISFDMFMNWVMQFLIENPTEVVTFYIQPEVEAEHQEEFQLILDRTREYLLRYDSYINPSTGEKFLYSETSTYGDKFTYIPKLKDCRGKIIIACNNNNSKTLGGMVYQNLLEVHSVKDSQSVGPDKRVENIMELYNEYCGTLLPSDAETHVPDLNIVGINCTSKSIGTPMEVERIVFDRIFNTMHLLEDRGVYYGFWRGDAITEWEANYLWRTNYSDNLQYCTVTVQSGLDGTPVQTFILLKGTTITIPGCIYSDAPSENFLGWGVGGVVRSKGDEFKVDGDVLFRALWKNLPFKVDFDVQGHGTAPEWQYVEYGGKVTEPDDPTAVGYTFAGWYKEAECRNEWDFDNDTVSGDTILYAKWAADTYTVTLDNQGGSASPGSLTATYDSGSFEAVSAPTRTGSAFKGYFTAAEGGTMLIAPADSMTAFVDATVEGYLKDGKWCATEGKTVYAQWEIEVYDVTFDMKGHGTAPKQQHVEYGGKVTKPADPVATGFVFGGWFEDAGCTDVWDFDNDTVSGQLTLYAKWAVAKYSVRVVQGDNGTVLNEGTYMFGEGDPISIKDDTMVIGLRDFRATPDPKTATAVYSFFGWIFEGGQPPSTVTKDMTITAVFEAAVTPQKDDEGNTTIDAKNEGDSVIQANIPVGTKTLSVTGSDYAVSVSDASALSGSAVTIAVEPMDNPSSKVSGTAYEFRFEKNGSAFTGKMSVTLPFQPAEGKKAVVYFVNGDDVQKMNVTGSGKDSVTFETDHNSVYVVSYEDEGPSAGYTTILVICAAACAVIAVAVAAILVMRKKSA